MRLSKCLLLEESRHDALRTIAAGLIRGELKVESQFLLASAAVVELAGRGLDREDQSKARAIVRRLFALARRLRKLS